LRGFRGAFIAEIQTTREKHEGGGENKRSEPHRPLSPRWLVWRQGESRPSLITTPAKRNTLHVIRRRGLRGKRRKSVGPKEGGKEGGKGMGKVRNPSFSSNVKKKAKIIGQLAKIKTENEANRQAKMAGAAAQAAQHGPGMANPAGIKAGEDMMAELMQGAAGGEKKKKKAHRKTKYEREEEAKEAAAKVSKGAAR